MTYNVDNRLRIFFTEVLGSGTFGTVYKGETIGDEEPQQVAVKDIVSKNKTGGKQIERELLPQKLRHENIINILFFITRMIKSTMAGVEHITGSRWFVVLEYCDHSLTSFMKYCNPGLLIVKRLMYQCCMGILHIHKHNYIHRDIKPENILIKFGLKIVQAIS